MSYHYGDVAVGLKVCREYKIDQQVYSGFLALFQDHNSLHIDTATASSMGFKGPLMHGAIQNGFLSHFIGMIFPGDKVLLQMVDLQFKKPCYLEDLLRIDLEVEQKVDAFKVLVLRVKIENITQSYVCTMGRIQVAMAK